MVMLNQPPAQSSPGDIALIVAVVGLDALADVVPLVVVFAAVVVFGVGAGACPAVDILFVRSGSTKCRRQLTGGSLVVSSPWLGFHQPCAFLKQLGRFKIAAPQAFPRT